MATNLGLDDRMILMAKKLGKHKTKTEAVMAALEEYIRHRRQLRILDMVGKVDYDDDYDYKKMRNRKVR